MQATCGRDAGHMWEGCWPHVGGMLATCGRDAGHMWEGCWPHVGGMLATCGRDAGHMWEGCWPHVGGMLATCGRDAGHMWEGCWPHVGGMLATCGSGKTSSRCWTHKPEGLTTVSLGNDHRTERTLKSGCSAIVSVVGTTRKLKVQGSWGVAFRICHVCAGPNRLFQTCQICPVRWPYQRFGEWKGCSGGCG